MKNVTYTSASAGTGKTYYLTETLADLIIQKKCLPEEVIMTTFSESAAEDLKARAKEKLYQKSIETGDAALADMAERLDEAIISTIHGMCRQLICKYWFLLNLSPEMDVIADEDKQFFFSHAINESVRDKDTDFFDNFEKEFDIKAEKSWRKNVLSMLEKMASYDIYNLNPSKEYSIKIAKLFLTPGNKSTLPSLEEIKRVYERVDGFIPASKRASFERDKNNVQETFPCVEEVIRYCNTNAKTKNATKDFINTYGDIYTSEVVNKHLCDYISLVFRIAETCFQKYSDYKRLHNLIDYSDMERYAHEILTQEKYEVIRKEIAESYKYLFVDEFQDCSPMQVKIFDVMSHLIKGGCFWVGDMKQIVYSWRGAHPLLIEAVIEKLKADDSCNLGKDLNVSRRSAPAIVDAVKHTFSNLYPETSNFEHCEKRAKECENLNDSLRLWPISEDITIEKYVYSLINDEKVAPGSIAILGRNNLGLGTVANALERVGISIDCSALDNNKGADNPIVALVMAVLKVAANKRDHQAKAEIAYLLSAGWGISKIVDAKLEWNNRNSEDVKEFLSDVDIISAISDNRSRWLAMPICCMVQSVIIDLNLHAAAMTIKGANNVDAVMQTILDESHNYEDKCLKMGFPATISGFVNYLSELSLSKKGGQDSVHLRTYHKSKGCEWDYVILTDLQNDANRPNEWYDNNYGGVHTDHPLKPTAENLYTETLIRLQPWLFGSKKTLPDSLKNKIDKNLCDTIKSANVAEAARLMYVGMTRARNVLIFATKKENIENLNDVKVKWFDVIGAPFPAKHCKVVSLPDFTLNTASKQSVQVIDIRSNDCEEHLDICRDINPSECKTIGDAHRLAYWDTRLHLQHSSEKEVSDAEIGNALHLIYCCIERNRNLQNIKNILETHGIVSDDKLIASIIENWDRLISFLTATYGKGNTFHELPFKYKHNGQIFTGSIDFVWETKDGAVIVDYKSCQLGVSHIENKNDAHYAGRYKGQLDCYATALQKAGRKVLDSLIFYPSLGLVEKVI